MSTSKKQFLRNLAFQNKWKILFSIILGIGSSSFNGVSTALLAPVILSLMGQDAQIGNLPPTLKILLEPFQDIPDRYRLMVISGAIIILIILKSATTYCNTLVSAQFIRSISSRVRKEALKVYFSVDLSYLNEIKRGDLINRISSEVDRAVGTLNIWIQIFTTSISIFILFMLLISLSWQLTVALALIYPIYPLSNQFIVRQSRTLGQKMTILNRNILSHLYEMVEGTKLIRSSCTEDQEYQKASSYVTAKENLVLETLRIKSLMAPLSEITNIFVLFVLIWVARFILQGHTESLTTTTIFLSYLVVLYRTLPFLSQINGQRSSLAHASSALDLVVDFLDTSKKPFTTSGKRELTEVNQGIYFNHISFVYPGTEETVLEDIDLYVPQGTTLALVGSSGSGKSTLADLLPRFYHPKSGKIEIDGFAIEEFDVKSLRQAIGIVSQDTFVFNDTVRYNIAYGRESATLDEVMEAAHRANAYDFIQALPEGFETHIGNRGVRLSGGQRQRIAIARALIQNPTVLILDEATSALDTISERLVQAALDELSTTRTCIIIAHRLSTIQNAEQIAVLDKGRVKEVGTHDQLLARNGIYAELYQTQAKPPGSLKDYQSEWSPYLTDISYDIRSSLNTILGSLSLLTEDLVDDEMERKLLLQSSSQEGLRLLDRLETFESFLDLHQENH